MSSQSPPQPQPTPRTMSLPRSFTAPDAWFSTLLAFYLQYRLIHRRHHKRVGQIKPTPKSTTSTSTSTSTPTSTSTTTDNSSQSPQNQNNQRRPPWSLFHEWLFTDLRMMKSPYAKEASSLGAEVLDLHSEQDLDRFTKEAIETDISSAKRKTKKSRGGGSGGSGRSSNGRTMEVRTRRIRRGELRWDNFYFILESVLNLAFSIFVGLLLRWMLGLIRSLRLSTSTGYGMGGPCCSPYRGGDDEGTRLAGSFERLLICMLVKGEGEDAGNLFFTLLLLGLLVGVVRLAWRVSDPAGKLGQIDDDADEEWEDKDEKTAGKKSDNAMKRIHPKKVKGFFVGMGATLSAFWLFQTPALLRVFGLAGLTEAAEEWSARVILFGRLLGVVSPTAGEMTDGPNVPIQTLSNLFFLILAIVWGFIASAMMIPIQETARNAAYVLSPTKQNTSKKPTPNETMDLINTRLMLMIQALAPFFVMATYLSASQVGDIRRQSSGRISFSKQYMQNSSLFVRVAMCWCFFFASVYTFRPLLQSFLDQASTVASAMAALGEAGADTSSSKSGRGSKKQSASPSPPKTDPFHDRYSKVVLTAGRIAAFPAFVFTLLAFAHLLGGDGSVHPGVGHVSLPKGAPRDEILAMKALASPYKGSYVLWMANKGNSMNDARMELVEAAALSHVSWNPTPFRDAVHRKFADWFSFCEPPESRPVKALTRHVDYILSDEVSGKSQLDGSVLTIKSLTGQELLNEAPYLPMSLIDFILGRGPSTPSGSDGSCIESLDSERGEIDGDGNMECKAEVADVDKVRPSLRELMSSLVLHDIMTPTVVFPVLDSISFLASVWWTYFYTVMTIVYWIKLRGTAFMQVAA